MAVTPPQINELRHPQFILDENNWFKWRLTSLGGRRFLEHFLVRFNKRESDKDFQERRKISYVPAFAKKALNKIRNAMFKQMGNIIRAGGPKSYQDASSCADPRGVDFRGSSMTSFMGRYILPEMLTMRRVGVYVDRPPLSGPTLADVGDNRPYLYMYCVENIRSWAYNRHGDPTEFHSLLLEDSDYELTERWGLPYAMVNRLRYLTINPKTGNVVVQFFNKSVDDKGVENWYGDTPRELKIKKIPFVCLEISESLLTDAADYQIALMNLASTGISYACKGNYPFYVEQVDWRYESPHLQQSNTVVESNTEFEHSTHQYITMQDTIREILVGGTGGRQYPRDTERPAFINPSPEPLKVAMAKEEQMKREIDELITESLSSLTPILSHKPPADTDAISAGLRYIGDALEYGERKIAELWAMYEGEKPATVSYPDTYSLLSAEDRQAHVTFLKNLIPHVPSITYQREMAKEIAEYSIGNKIDDVARTKINAEIDAAPVVYGDPKVIASDIENGLVSLETASKARGYPDGEVEQAKKDHAEKIARIAAAQTPGEGYGARGVSDLSLDPQDAKKEKKESQSPDPTDPNPTKKTRGEAE